MTRSTRLALPASLFALAALAAPAAAQAPDWTIDPAHSRAQFAVRHMMVSTVRGQMGRVTGTVRFDGKDVSGLAVEAAVDAGGVDTNEPPRDKHLRSADFFDVETFPTITFRSKRAEPAGAGRFKLVGDLTMHGVTKEVVLDVEGPSPEIRQGATRRIGASATTTISRKDFGLTWNRAVETGGVVVGDEVSITLDVELTRPATPAGT
jgi:polyisoprenoid-binding protein YceI